MNKLILNCNWEKEDNITIFNYENDEGFDSDKLNINICVGDEVLDLMLNEESSLKLLEFLKEKLEEK